MLARTSRQGSEPRTVGTRASADDFSAGGLALVVGAPEDGVAIGVVGDQSQLIIPGDQWFGKGSNRGQVIPDHRPVIGLGRRVTFGDRSGVGSVRKRIASG